MNILKMWFNRNPYVPAVSQEVRPQVVDPDLAKLTKESGERIEKHARDSRSLTLSVINIHDDLLKLVGHRA